MLVQRRSLFFVFAEIALALTSVLLTVGWPSAVTAQCISAGVWKKETYCFGGTQQPPPVETKRPPSPEETRQGLLDSAEALLARGMLKEALRELDEALEADPGDAEAAALRARIQSATVGSRPQPVVNTDTSVVDARRTGVNLALPVPEQMNNSAAMEEWLRGMDAVKARDWVLAAAWFRKGLQKDPSNGALQRAAELSDFTKAMRDQEAAASGVLLKIDAAFAAQDAGDRGTYDRIMAEIRNSPYYGDPQAKRWREIVFQRIEERSLAGGPKPYARMTQQERIALTYDRLTGEALAEDCERIATAALVNGRVDDARLALQAAVTLAPHISYYRRYAEILQPGK